MIRKICGMTKLDKVRTKRIGDSVRVDHKEGEEKVIALVWSDDEEQGGCRQEM